LHELFELARHGEIYGMSFVVPFEGDATIQGAGPVKGHFVLGGDDINKVLGMFLASILDTKIIDNQTEEDGTCGCLKSPGVYSSWW
jgi:hypothetical protein